MGDPISQDSRFKKLGTDKKFRKVGRKHKKVKIDSRFQSLFTQDKFLNKCSVDKRGRPKHLSAKEDYEKFYDLDSSDEDEESDEKNKPLKKTNKKADSTDESDSDEENQSDVEEEENEEEEDPDCDNVEENEEPNSDLGEDIMSKLRDSKVDYARGEGRLYSSDSSSGEDDTEDEDDDARAEADAEVFDKWGEMDGEAERTEDATERIAVCNMDWDRVGAPDIFLALSSFCPSSGCVKSVKIFLSEFGRERLKEEEELGPAELRGHNEEKDDDDSDDEEGDILPNHKKAKAAEAAAMARVRQYQVNRLKYYYAVVEFDSVDTSDSVYTECDGMEYELSATRFDLRFIPQDMKFTENPTEVCVTPPDPNKYQPKIFQTSALQQQKVELTWDETDPNKLKAMRRAFEVEAEDEMEKVGRELIASASEDDDDEDNEVVGSGSDDEGDIVNDKDTISKYRSMLADILGNGDEKQKDEGNMEVTWEDGQQEEEEEKEQCEEEIGPWQKYLQKKKEKKKNRKNAKKAEQEDNLCSDDDIPDGVDMNDPFFAEEFGKEFKKEKVKDKKKKKRKNVDDKGLDVPENKALDLLVDSDDEKNHFNFKDIVENESNPTKTKKKWKKKKKEIIKPVEDNFSVDVSDERFGALFTRPEFNIDPTESSFKKTKNMEKIIGEKLKRIQDPTVNDKSLEAERPVKKPKLEADISQSLKTVKNKWKQNAKKNRSKKI